MSHENGDHRRRPGGSLFRNPAKEAVAGRGYHGLRAEYRADETFGFGVVFSDATLDNFEKYDKPSYDRITREFAYWDDIAIHFRESEHRIGGNGFCGCSRRTLLLILQDRASELGVTLRYEVDVDDEKLFADADLVLFADGANSRFRERYAEHFQPEVDLRPNKFAWMGSTRPLDAFTFIFQITEWGPFIAHAYQYEPGRSTWVFETDPETFERAGLHHKTEAESAELMETIFGWFLGDHKILTNRSIWRNFPMIRNKRWVMGNKVLMGDANRLRTFPSAQARNSRWKMQLRCLRRLGAMPPSRGRLHFTKRAGARRSKKPSTQPMSLLSGSSIYPGSGISTRCSSHLV